LPRDGQQGAIEVGEEGHPQEYSLFGHRVEAVDTRYLQSVGFVHGVANMGEAALEAPAPGGLSERNDVPTDPGLPEMTSADVDEAAQDLGRLALE
jgi:hypothetical protein